jgi:hypothetical protein
MTSEITIHPSTEGVVVDAEKEQRKFVESVLRLMVKKYIVPNTSSDITQLFTLFPLLSEVCIYGTTPSFNDGDPCRHSGYYYIRYNEFLYGLEDDAYFSLDSVKRKSPSKIYLADAEEYQISEEEEDPEFVTMILQTLGSLDSFFERDFSTNSVTFFAREGEKVNKYSCRYYCGY